LIDITAGILIIALIFFPVDSSGIAIASDSQTANTASLSMDSFRLEGNIPAQFGMIVVANYQDNEKKCLVRKTADKNFKHYKSSHIFSSGVNSEAHNFLFDIPLEYRQKNCTLKIADIQLKIEAYYVDKRNMESHDYGEIYITENLHPTRTNTEARSDTLIKGTCGWKFYEYERTAGVDDIKHSLACHVNLVYLPANELPTKKIALTLERLPDEPYAFHTWVKFPKGWKPCTTIGSSICIQPKQFREFKMNNATCTVYPACKE